MTFIFHQKAIILNGVNKFLVLKASYKGERWDLPGGAVELPETYEKALRREVKEETGLEIENIKPIQVESAYNQDTKEYVLFIGYTSQASSSEVSLSDEHTEFKWITKDEFLQLEATPYLKEFISAF